VTTTHGRGLHRAASLAALGLLAAALPTTAQAASDPLAGLGCMALGGGATVAAIVSNDVRFEIGALVSSGVLWAGGTGLVVAQGVRNQRAPAPTASAPQRVVVAPWWSGRQVGVGLAMRL